jgi:hypothetical protein
MEIFFVIVLGAVVGLLAGILQETTSIRKALEMPNQIQRDFLNAIGSFQFSALQSDVSDIQSRLEERFPKMDEGGRKSLETVELEARIEKLEKIGGDKK